ncbi:MAG: hypothetical protein H7X95_06810 [Deltaproteobacteria bacterium]|nr:hypothetical protein [Deltaproteobacteria bacterium]
MPRIALVVLCGGVALVAGCVTPSQNRQDNLIRITRQYNDGLRWGRYQDVVAHLAADEAAKFLARTGSLADDFEMADHEVTSISFKDQGMRAEVTVDFTWYNLRRSLLRKTLVGQDWRFVEGRWICAVQRRVRGDRFPLVPEQIAEVAPSQPAPSPGPPLSQAPNPSAP